MTFVVGQHIWIIIYLFW